MPETLDTIGCIAVIGVIIAVVSVLGVWHYKSMMADRSDVQTLFGPDKDKDDISN
jgi:hypothetical protein